MEWWKEFATIVSFFFHFHSSKSFFSSFTWCNQFFCHNFKGQRLNIKVNSSWWFLVHWKVFIVFFHSQICDDCISWIRQCIFSWLLCSLKWLQSRFDDILQLVRHSWTIQIDCCWSIWCFLFNHVKKDFSKYSISKENNCEIEWHRYCISESCVSVVVKFSHDFWKVSCRLEVSDDCSDSIFLDDFLLFLKCFSKQHFFNFFDCHSHIFGHINVSFFTYVLIEKKTVKLCRQLKFLIFRSQTNLPFIASSHVPNWLLVHGFIHSHKVSSFSRCQLNHFTWSVVVVYCTKLCQVKSVNHLHCISFIDDCLIFFFSWITFQCIHLVLNLFECFILVFHDWFFKLHDFFPDCFLQLCLHHSIV